jgi:hypothetical protein
VRFKKPGKFGMTDFDVIFSGLCFCHKAGFVAGLACIFGRSKGWFSLGKIF